HKSTLIHQKKTCPIGQSLFLVSRLLFHSFNVLFYQAYPSLYTFARSQAIFRSIHTIVNQTFYSAGGHMHTSIRRGIVNQYFAIVLCNPAIGKYYIRHITHSFNSLGSNDMSSRTMDDLGRVFEGGHEHIQDIAQTCGCIAYAMSKMQPPFISFYRRRPLTILNLIDRMVATVFDNDFFSKYRLFHAVA